jgi:hypothetical protein
MVFSRCISHWGCGKANSYRRDIDARTTVCSRYEILRPMQPLELAEKEMKYGCRFLPSSPSRLSGMYLGKVAFVPMSYKS